MFNFINLAINIWLIVFSIIVTVKLFEITKIMKKKAKAKTKAKK